ncbi:MAG: cyclic nucleotide-binding domain-containing protein [Candidatus Zixiibacteriota bacterium]|nr:MAG: cyclic nucleotide-binding domain-containing protein [candidate division Zixibacteria bacterium]
MLTTIEKVIFLQDVDIFEYTSTEDLSHIAAITTEIEVKRNNIIYNEGDISDAMYMIIDGAVSLRREGIEIMEGKVKDVFGTWALFDDEPRVVTATAVEDCRLLRILKEDFIELLGDHVGITQGVLKKMVKRLRGLVGRVGKEADSRNSP